MAGGPIQLWNEWAVQILVMLSFGLQIFLFLFARTRRHGPSAVLRILLWLAYLMADSTAVYTLGHLSINGSPREQKLTVFWAPFLLVHLGSQDTITAYALEDNKLWPRHLLNLGVQAFGVAYVLYKHITEVPTSLGLATGLIFIIGLIKYGERIWALKCATLDSIRSSIHDFHFLPTYFDEIPPKRPWEEERDEEELLLFAQAMLPLCKGVMADFPLALYELPREGHLSLRTSCISNWNWKATLKVVEMELSLMYDILYTKAAVIHNWYGYLFRLVMPLATATAFVLFQLSDNEDGYRRVDVAITYTLLVGAFLLDMASVFNALGSSWTCNLLLDRGWNRLSLAILSLRRRVKAAAGNRGWSGSIGQFNLVHICNRTGKVNLSIRVAYMMGLMNRFYEWLYMETIVISEDVKELVFKRVWQALKEIHEPGAKHETQYPPYEKGVEEHMAMMPSMIAKMVFFRPESYEDTTRRRTKLTEALNLGGELQEVILTWHVCTGLFLVFSWSEYKDDVYLNATKALSNYMSFLVAVCPDMIPGLELRSLYKETRNALDACGPARPRGQHGYPFEYTTIADEKLAFNLENREADRALKNSTARHGILYANLLLKLADTGNPDKSAVISRYEGYDPAAMDKLKLYLMPDLESLCQGGVFNMDKAMALILDAWVRLLILASVRCSRDAHARLINCGGELTTIVRLMEEHAAIFFKPPGEDIPLV